jgi:hypothetical protein
MQNLDRGDRKQADSNKAHTVAEVTTNARQTTTLLREITSQHYVTAMSSSLMATGVPSFMGVIKLSISGAWANIGRSNSRIFAHGLNLTYHDGGNGITIDVRL